MRVLTALLGLVLLAAATPQKRGARDWRTVATLTPGGAYRIGNPAARVKLVEYASYTCPHCAAFAAESEPVLKGQMVRSGQVSLELRHLIRDTLDLSAAVLARCAGPGGFAPMTAAIFATQNQWLGRGYEYQQSNAAILSTYSRLDQLRALADGAGLTAIAQAHGLSARATDACFADAGGVDRILRLTAATPAEVDSTPTFYVNGKLVSRVGWAGLLPALRAAGAR